MPVHALRVAGSPLWRSVLCSGTELRLDLTLCSGQSFRWRETAEGHWTGVMGGRVWTLTQKDDMLWYHVYKNQRIEEGGRKKRRDGASSIQHESKAEAVKKEEDEELLIDASGQSEEEERLLRDYFQLDVKLEDLYRDWGAADDHFRNIAHVFPGIRMLRQDPTECLFSFICTSNNHISRIQGMVERLCQTLGAPLCQLDSNSYHDFPTLTALADSSVEARLRDLGFGYRARFLQQSARQILDSHGLHWLDGLRRVPYPEAREALRTLPGVGTKVADCVCLMSLDKLEAVPVDTHVWQIAKRDYNCTAGKDQKSITDRLHRDIGDFFRKLWGPYAGWAQSVLFCSDLKKFKSLKELSPVKTPKQEEGEERTPTLKREFQGVMKKQKAKSTCQKKAKISVKKEKFV